jgi:ATP-dependent Clp protease ATP-binding subunit ClpB
MRRYFRPEFLNRVDDVVVFRPLSRVQLRQIVELQLERVRQLLADRHIALDITESAEDAIAEEGFDPAFGARPLKRAIQRLVQNPLALRILEGEFEDGDSIRIDRGSGNELTFNKVTRAAAVA